MGALDVPSLWQMKVRGFGGGATAAMILPPETDYSVMYMECLQPPDYAKASAVGWFI